MNNGVVYFDSYPVLCGSKVARKVPTVDENNFYLKRG